MTRVRTSTWLFGLMLGLLLASPSSLQVRAQDGSPSDLDRYVPAMHDRLQQLHPSRPEEYLELGEEVLAEMPTARGRSLARTLLVLAYELDPAHDGASATKTSACLALASIAFDDAERRWLELLASTRSGAPLTLAPGGVSRRTLAQHHSIAHEVAELIARLRAETASAWKSSSQREAVEGLMEAIAESMGEAGEIFDRVKTRQVCPECGSRRTVRARNSNNDSPFEYCPTCGGNPGARLGAAHFMATLRAEAALTEAEVRTWSGQLHVDDGAPMRDTQGQSIAPFYGVEPQKTYWSSVDENANEIGSWVERSDHAQGDPANPVSGIDA